MNQPNFYAIIPANIRYDDFLKPNAKLLYGEITALCGREGFCWAGNEYFAELYKVSLETISRWISQLANRGYLVVEIHKKEGNKRQIFLKEATPDLLTKKSIPIDKKINRVLTKKSIPIDKKIKSNIRMNNTINNTMNREEKALAFFEKNSPSEWDNFQMRFMKNFDLKEWEKFKELFNCKIDEEGLEFTTKIISARLTRFAINYIQNLNKEKTKIPASELNYKSMPSSKKLD
ncbi:helix-turn-helix domain-containing protein [Flavobacterium aquiphilum]|uniref:helix-turn-helix domain-containing protein n=1 Tax=Flavobacterium aquiphilum TaxID=3003261 RepID=UPI002480A6B5|nr:helix-turn-helix domain-containing protein [Flavobacterium aquiphilum]